MSDRTFLPCFLDPVKNGDVKLTRRKLDSIFSDKNLNDFPF